MSHLNDEKTKVFLKRFVPDLKTVQTAIPFLFATDAEKVWVPLFSGILFFFVKSEQHIIKHIILTQITKFLTHHQ